MAVGSRSVAQRPRPRRQTGGGLAVSCWMPIVDMVTAGISHHVEDEEKEALPKLRKSLGLAGGSSSGEPTKEELYEQAKEAGIEGRSTMSKAELAEAVEKS